MQEAFLSQAVRFINGSTRELAQKIPDLRLVATDQLPEGRRVLRRDGQGYEVMILAIQRCCCLDYCSRSVTRHMMM